MSLVINAFGLTKEWALHRGLKLWAAETTGSTNSIAKDDEELATKPSGPLPSLYIAAAQSQGRGRGDHVWTTPPGSCLLSSWAYSIPKVPQPIFTAIVGLALYEAAQEAWPTVEFNVKAPNDLFVGDKKIAGILVETVDQGASKRTVIGFGLNVSDSPAGLTTATHLAAHLPSVDASSWTQFLDLVLTKFSNAVREGQNSELTESTCVRLLSALNKHPLLKEPILRVDELGQLHSASRLVRWHEL